MRPRKFHCCLGLLLSATGFLSTAGGATLHTVTMKSITYEPKSLAIKAGDDVRWVNKSYTEHSATSYENEDPALKFDTGLIQPQETSRKVSFAKAGTYSYHCTVHGKTMTGKINVTP